MFTSGYGDWNGLNMSLANKHIGIQPAKQCFRNEDLAENTGLLIQSKRSNQASSDSSPVLMLTMLLKVFFSNRTQYIRYIPNTHESTMSQTTVLSWPAGTSQTNLCLSHDQTLKIFGCCLTMSLWIHWGLIGCIYPLLLVSCLLLCWLLSKAKKEGSWWFVSSPTAGDRLPQLGNTNLFCFDIGWGTCQTN